MALDDGVLVIRHLDVPIDRDCYHYLLDRISGTFAMPSLAELIQQRSAVSN